MRSVFETTQREKIEITLSSNMNISMLLFVAACECVLAREPLVGDRLDVRLFIRLLFLEFDHPRKSDWLFFNSRS